MSARKLSASVHVNKRNFHVENEETVGRLDYLRSLRDRKPLTASTPRAGTSETGAGQSTSSDGSEEHATTERLESWNSHAFGFKV